MEGLFFFLEADGLSEYVESGAGDEEEFLSMGFWNEEEELKAEMREKL